MKRRCSTIWPAVLVVGLAIASAAVMSGGGSQPAVWLALLDEPGMVTPPHLEYPIGDRT